MFGCKGKKSNKNFKKYLKWKENKRKTSFLLFVYVEKEDKKFDNFN